MRKIITAVIACVLLMTTVAQAAQKKAAQTLTVSQAAKAAISVSSALRTNEDNIVLLDEAADKIKDNLRLSQDHATNLNLAVQLMQNTLNKGYYSGNETMQKDRIMFTITQVFAQIINAESDLRMYDENMALTKKSLDISKLKLELGMISQSEYDKTLSEYEKMSANREAKVIAIDKAYISLNSAMGTSLDKKYLLELDLKYEPLGDVYLTQAIQNTLDNSLDLQKKYDDLAVAEYQLASYYEHVSSQSEEELEIRVQQAGRAVNDTKTQIEQSVTTLYNDLKNAEASLAASRLDLENMKSQLALRETQLAVGKLTQLDVDTYKYQIAVLEETIRISERAHALNIMKFKTPNLATM
ncbi:MAG: TolC family protein [Clostridiales bacterium]|jgi:hypothetical protein|nr:TolC family protein [Clostridiales bacterium]